MQKLKFVIRKVIHSICHCHPQLPKRGSKWVITLLVLSSAEISLHTHNSTTTTQGSDHDWTKRSDLGQFLLIIDERGECVWNTKCRWIFPAIQLCALPSDGSGNKNISRQRCITGQLAFYRPGMPQGSGDTSSPLLGNLSYFGMIILFWEQLVRIPQICPESGLALEIHEARPIFRVLECCLFDQFSLLYVCMQL